MQIPKIFFIDASRGEQVAQLNKNTHANGNFMCIYGNPSNFDVGTNGNDTNGGFLMEAAKRVFENKQFVCNRTSLNDITLQMRLTMTELVNEAKEEHMLNVENVSTMQYNVYFERMWL